MPEKNWHGNSRTSDGKESRYVTIQSVHHQSLYKDPIHHHLSYSASKGGGTNWKPVWEFKACLATKASKQGI